MDKQILIADEVAELLRVDRQRVYQLVREKRLPVIHIGQRQYRFAADAIARWLATGGNDPSGVEATEHDSTRVDNRGIDRGTDSEQEEQYV